MSDDALRVETSYLENYWMCVEHNCVLKKVHLLIGDQGGVFQSITNQMQRYTVF